MFPHIQLAIPATVLQVWLVVLDTVLLNTVLQVWLVVPDTVCRRPILLIHQLFSHMQQIHKDCSETVIRRSFAAQLLMVVK
jgi:hypothetical protein